jgi:hypothetical protein
MNTFKRLPTAKIAGLVLFSRYSSSFESAKSIDVSTWFRQKSSISYIISYHDAERRFLAYLRS